MGGVYFKIDALYSKILSFFAQKKLSLLAKFCYRNFELVHAQGVLF